MIQVDVLIYGGGAAGLWTLATLRQQGYRALLLEKSALGAGQTIQSQGIIHGGFKYAIPGVREMDSTSEIRDMPDRWRRSLAGASLPNLSGVNVLSKECLFWFPPGEVTSFIGGKVLQALRAKPQRLNRAAWPKVLSHNAAVYSVPEMVLDTGSLLRTLSEIGDGWVKLKSPDTVPVEAKVTVLAGGKGNADLLQQFGHDPHLMQLRPLRMIMLKGKLPLLYGHCIEKGRTGLTITSHPWQGEVVWQVGGEIAEKYANETDYARVRREALRVLIEHFPDLDRQGLQIGTYHADRAEGCTKRGRRPSRVQVLTVSPNLIVAWPTKLALAPVLADEVVSALSKITKPSGAEETAPADLPVPRVAAYPWENAEWFSVT